MSGTDILNSVRENEEILESIKEWVVSKKDLKHLFSCVLEI